MLVRPKTFGAGLFDYSCQGANWIYSDEAVSRAFQYNEIEINVRKLINPSIETTIITD